MPPPRRPAAPRQPVPPPYLQCPDCAFTVRTSAFYLRGDRCPRCQTPMLLTATLRFGRGPLPADAGARRSAWRAGSTAGAAAARRPPS